jgi:hypothetical protein
MEQDFLAGSTPLKAISRVPIALSLSDAGVIKVAINW